jgi:hypothetical protein
MGIVSPCRSAIACPGWSSSEMEGGLLIDVDPEKPENEKSSAPLSHNSLLFPWFFTEIVRRGADEFFLGPR